MLQFLLTLTDESNHGKIEHLYNKYHDYMMKCAVTKFKSLGRSNYTYDAEDAVQNAFMKITKYIDKIDFSRGEKDVKNYCLAILSNEICNVLSDNQENYVELISTRSTLEMKLWSTLLSGFTNFIYHLLTSAFNKSAEEVSDEVTPEALEVTSSIGFSKIFPFKFT